MKGNWQFDRHHAARPPPVSKDFQKEALDVLLSWVFLLFFVIVLGTIAGMLGIGNDIHHDHHH